jgi:TP901 family phage tail tape measure protein
MSRVFRREFDMMSRVAEQNVRQMQTQYTALGRSATGAAQAMAFTPNALNQQAAATQIAAQRQMMMNRMIDLGTTKLLNWGKNTQWAGRQLMVGFSIPLAMMGAAAAKAFKEIDKGTISFKRVYGDLQTTTAEMERNLGAVKDLGMEYTKYGKSLASTIELAADVAATGAKNETLIAATEQTLRLATLGLMEYDEALEATIALQTAFQVSNEDLGSTIDFLNVVENETILTMQDMAAAIPRVAPVIKGLGGDVKDLAVFMTALREGGVTAEQGANALKSGLGRLINPTKAAREEAEKYGISIENIVQRNKGDLMGTVQEFGDAMSVLGQLEQQQLLQKVFGTFQYARLGALFRNLSNDAGQAQRTMDLTAMSVQDLAKISERELGKIEEATSVKFQAAIEQLKVSIAPIGETFMKALTPILDFISRMLTSFNELPDNVKNIIAIVIAAVAGLGPIVLMTVGLIANGIANMGKLVQTMRKFFARLRGDASAFDYLIKEEREAASAANNLSGATDRLTGKFVGQQAALQTLTGLVGKYAAAMASAAAAMPLGMGIGNVAMAGAVMGARGGSVVSGPQSRSMATRGYQKGVVSVPGSGSGDKVPALLEPGESVVTKKATQTYASVIAAMNAGTLPGFVSGITSIGGISVPAPVAQYNIKSSSILPVEGIIDDIRRIDVGLDTLTSILREFAQTGRALSKTALTEALAAQGVSVPRGVPNVSGYSQAAGNVMDRSHIIGLGVERGTGLLSNFNSALQSSNPVIQQHAQNMLENSSIVELYKSGQDVLAREVTETSQVLNTLQNGIMGLTAGFKGTVMATPQAVNNLYNKMPQEIRGDTISLEKFRQQVDWAEQEFRELANKLNMTTAELSDDAAINNMVDESQKQYAKALKLLIAEGQETAQLQMTEQEFLKNRIKQMGLALQAEKGQTNATIANAEAEKFATQQMALFKSAGVFATDATIDYAKAMQVLAASALGQAGSMVVAGQGVPQQVAKRAAQRRQASGYAPVANMRSIPTSIIPTPNPRFTASTLGIDANRFSGIAQREGIVLGNAFGIGIVTGASQSTRNLVPAVITSSGHNSPAALMPATGTLDGTAYGKSFSDAVKKAIMTGSGAVIPPGGVVPPVPQTSRGTKGFAAQNAQYMKDMILGPKALSPIDQALIPVKAAAASTAKNMKDAFSAIKMGIVDASKPFTTPLKNAAQSAAAKVKDAYETAAIRTRIALDSVKKLPQTMQTQVKNLGDGMKSAFTTARGRFMNMVQTAIPENAGRRLRNRAFYGAQDMMGKARQAGGILMNPVPRAIAMAAVQQKAMEKLNSVVGSVTGRIRTFGATASKAGQILMNPVPRAIAMAAIMDKTVKPALTAMGNVADSVKSKFISFGAAVSKGAQILANPVPRAIALTAVKNEIVKASKFVLDTIKVNFQAAMIVGKSVIKQGFDNVKNIMKTSIQNVKQVFDSAKVTMKKSFDNLKSGIVLAGESIKKAGQSARELVVSSGQLLATAIKGAATQVKGAATQMAAGAAGWLGKVDEKTGRTRGQKMAAGGNTAMMGLMGVSMAASFLEGEMGELAQKIMPVTMGLMGLQMLLPMLKSPFGIATLAVAALAGSFVKARMDIDKAAREASDAGANIGGIANQLQVISEATGMEILTPEDRLFRFSAEDREAMGEFSSFFEGERGSKFVEDLQKMSSEERYKNVAKMLTTAIANGLSPEKAEAFGSAIAEATGDYILNSRVLADIRAGRIGGGSETLVEMARERMTLAPTVTGGERVGAATAFGGMMGGGGGINDIQRTRQIGTGIGLVAGGLIGAKVGASIGLAIGSVVPILGNAIGAGVGAAVGGIIGGATGWIGSWLATRDDERKIMEATAEAGRGLGFALQMIQDLANAEAVLAEERRQGKIAIEDAKAQEAEINRLQQEVTDYFVSLFGEGTSVDTDALKQAMKRQLAYQGFSEQQQDLIIADLDINKLAQEYFGSASYADLDQSQKDFISTVYQNILTGLTPENLDQRMQDVTGTWKTVAERYIDAIEAGLDPKEAFNKIGIEQWVTSMFPETAGRRTGGRGRAAQEEGTRSTIEFKEETVLPQLFEERTEAERKRNSASINYGEDSQEYRDAQQNLDLVDQKIKETNDSISELNKSLSSSDKNVAETIGTNVVNAIEEVNKVLEESGNTATITEEEFKSVASGFTDTKFLEDLLLTEDGAKRLAQAVVALRDFPDIEIELFLKDENFDPEKLKSEIDKMKDIDLVFDPKILGGKKAAKEMKNIAAAALPSPQEYANVLQQMGVSTDKFFTTYQEQAMTMGKALLEFPELVSKKTGKIKITGDFLVSLLGSENINNPDDLASRLNSAFPDRLSPIQMMIMVGLGGPGAALLAQAQEDPELKKAILAGTPGQEITYGGKTVSSPYGAFTTGGTTIDPGTAALIRSFFSAPSGGVPTGNLPTPDDKKGSTGGGSKEESALEELEKSIAERTRLYLSVTKAGEKLDKSKKGYANRLAAQTTTNNSIAGQLRKLNLSETLIADILGMGSEKAAEIIKQLGPNGLKKLNVADIVSRAGQFIDTKKGDVELAEYEKIATRRLKQTGRFSEEEIEDILEDEDATEIIAKLPKNKFTGLWRQLINLLRKTADATAEVVSEAEKAEKAFDEASNRFELLNDMMRQGFDQAEMEAADRVASKFFTDNTKLAEKLAKSTGHTITNGYELAEAMERQVALNERLIDQEQDKIDKKQEEINDYERTNSLIQQGIDNLRRSDEIRSRRSESLSRDLEEISEAEDKIRKSYQDRIDALDKVSRINDHLIQQQQKQINLSRAISEGDIYAATQAAQEMRAASAQQASEQTRLGLERGMESEIANLTNADGMTRVQIEEEIANIKEQSYQNSLLIRVEEDKIYANSLEIRRLSNEIYNIQEDIVEPLQNQNKEYSRMLDYYKDDEAYQISRVTLAGMTRDQFEKQADALALSIKNAKDLDPELKALAGRYADIAREAGIAAAAAQQVGSGISASGFSGPWQASAGAASSAGAFTVDLSGLTPDMFAGLDFSNLDFSGLNLGLGNMGFNSGGMVLGEGSRDSISAMLTPGEYVIRKAMVDKYGTPLMQALNQGSFAMPTYDTGPQMPEVGAINNTMVSNVNAPVYNTYDMKFAINGSNQSADEIANKVMFKMKQVKNQGIRSNRAY